MADNDADQDVSSVEITPEQFDGEQVAPKDAESSPAKEEKATPEAKAEDQSKEEAKGDDTPAEPDDKSDAQDTDQDSDDDKSDAENDSDNDKPTKGEERKSQLNNEIRDLVATKNSLKREVERLTGEVYQPASADDLAEEINPDTGEKYTNIEAKFEAMRQEQEMSKYNERVAEAQLAIGTESMRVLNDFPIFNPENKDEFDEELASEAAALLDANLIRDDNVPEIGEDGKPTGRGIVIGSNISPYRLYQTLARAAGISATKGQLKGQQAKEEMLANADAPASTAPPKTKKDPVLEIWEADD